MTGLFPVLVALAALIEVQGNTSIQLAMLSAAPETGVQFLVRLLAGVALLIALPLWSPRETPVENAAAYAGTFLKGPRWPLSGRWPYCPRRGNWAGHSSCMWVGRWPLTW